MLKRLREVFRPLNCWIPLAIVSSSFFWPISRLSSAESRLPISDAHVVGLLSPLIVGLVGGLLIMLVNLVLALVSKSTGTISKSAKLGSYIKASLNVLIVACLANFVASIIVLALHFVAEPTWIRYAAIGADALVLALLLFRTINEPLTLE